MVAIITDRFKKQVLNDLFTDVVDSAATYYIAIGRSQDWNATDAAPTPTNTAKTERDFRNNMQAMKKGEDVSYVIPRYNWSSGTTTSILPASSSITTFAGTAGAKALITKVTGSSDHGIISIFSP